MAVFGGSLQRPDQERRTTGRGERGGSAQNRSPQAALPDESLAGPEHQSHGGKSHYNSNQWRMKRGCFLGFIFTCLGFHFNLRNKTTLLYYLPHIYYYNVDTQSHSNSFLYLHDYENGRFKLKALNL